MKKLLAAMLALLLLALPLSSCGDKTEEQGNTVVNGDNSVDEFALLGIPADTNMDGKTFTVFNQPWQGYDPLAITDIKPNDGDLGNISEAAYLRASATEEKLDCVIVNHKADDDWKRGLSTLQNVIQSGGECPYDVLMIRTKQYLSLVTSGYLVEIDQIPYLNLDKEWWDLNSYDALALNNKAYAICSDMTINDDLNIANVYFNKDMVAKYGDQMTNPYGLVESGDWTFEKMYEMAQLVVSHPDGGAAVPGNTAEDIYGFGYIQDAAGAFLNAFGVQICTIDEDGKPVYTLGAEHAVTKMQKLMSVFKDTDTSINFHARLGYAAAEIAETETFLTGRELFCIGGFYYAADMRRSETEFGILPLPKYDKAQQNYITPIYSASLTASAVPITTADVEKTGIFMEYFAYKGNRIMRPALYDELLEGYLPRDEESLEMLDIIFETIKYDTGLIFNFNNIADNLFSQYSELKDTTVSSNATLWGMAVESEIETIMKSLREK